MPHALTELNLAEVTRPAVQGSEPAHEIRADVCVVGAGIAGLSAAIESARLHRDVVLVDSLPLIGGQMVHSLIGLFCGVFGNGPEYRQLTHGIFDDIFRDLGPAGDLHFQPGHTKTVYYNEVALGRWLERTIRSLGVRTILGTVLQRAGLRDGRITEIELASRYGNVTIAAHGFVDASGDAALTWQAGLPCWVPERPIYGSQQVIVENVDESHKPDWGEIDALLAARGDEHELLRRGGLAFFFPGRGTAVLNVTHIEAPLDPVAASQAQFDGRDQADAVIALLRSEFPKAFGEARVRAYGYPGRRQTRWIKGRHQLVREGGWDKAFAVINLDCDTDVEVPAMRVPTCQLQHGFGPDARGVVPYPAQRIELQQDAESFYGRRGVSILATCTPYQVGNIPVRGEHIAWMESSAVIYANSVLGARTNCEGTASAGAASLTGKIPCWGNHRDENRSGTHLIDVRTPVDSFLDWGMLGYFAGGVADRSGYTEVIERAGGRLLGDSCPAMSRVAPQGTRVFATDSAKQAHYLPAILGIEAWFGSLEDCVDAAVTGRWRGRLP
jgi:Aconitase X/FAD dependent oxidoreductase